MGLPAPCPGYPRGDRGEGIPDRQLRAITGSQRKLPIFLFDHLIGNREKAGWDSQSERCRGLEIDDELELAGLLAP
jgi:hypothetical protein